MSSLRPAGGCKGLFCNCARCARINLCAKAQGAVKRRNVVTKGVGIALEEGQRRTAEQTNGPSLSVGHLSGCLGRSLGRVGASVKGIGRGLAHQTFPQAGPHLMFALVATTVASFHGVIPAQAILGAIRDRSTDVELAQVQSGRYGPYATIRRANEVANYFRSLGFDAQVIYGGTLDYREYYVDVW
jgi:hypothetical protein